jgi:uncharacterized membrane protein
MTAQRLFVIAGLSAALLFTFITPPFQVPDEVGHFWRAVSIAHGAVLPEITRAGGVALIPQGYSTLVFVLWRDTTHSRDVKITRDQFRTSWDVRREDEKSARVTFPPGYTFVPYIPQTAAALVARVIPIRPVITFYLGRIFNAVAYVLLIALAMRIAPAVRWLIAGVALLPMAMFLASSWSADAMTIALACLFTAALLRGVRTSRELALVSVCGVLVGLCKPAYFLIALLALVVPVARGYGRAIVIAATAAGVAISMWSAARTFPSVRPDVQINPAAQGQCIREQPSRFVEALTHELRFEYVQQAIGRLGILDVPLPGAVIWAELLLLLLCAWSSANVSALTRAVAAIITAGTITGIGLSLYIGYTPVCARTIDGLQGRYLLPIVPTLLIAISAPFVRREQFTRVAVVLVAPVANALALAAVASRYYR